MFRDYYQFFPKSIYSARRSSAASVHRPRSRPREHRPTPFNLFFSRSIQLNLQLITATMWLSLLFTDLGTEMPARFPFR